MDHSCQFNFRQIQKSNISAFQSPGDNFDFLPTFDFSMPGDLSLCQSYTLSTQTSTPTIASINQSRAFSLKRVHISASQLLYSWLKGMFFFSCSPVVLTQGGLTWLTCWDLQSLWLCVSLLISAFQHPLAEKLYLSLFVHLSDRPSVPHWWPRLLCPLLV